MLNFIITLMLLSSIFAQDSDPEVTTKIPGAWFLTINPSAEIFSLGGSGVSIDSKNVFSTYYNPALSPLADKKRLIISGFRVKWLPSLIRNNMFYSYAAQRFHTHWLSFNQIKIQFAVTLSETYFDLGTINIRDGSLYNLADSNPYHLAVGVSPSATIQLTTIPLYLGLGWSNKIAYQNFDYNEVSSTSYLTDWGIRMGLYNLSVIEKSDFRVGFNYSVGYSESNVGDDIYFIDIEKGNPPPTIIRFGITYGPNIYVKKQKIFSYNITQEVSELMPSDFFGDINIHKHIYDANYNDASALAEDVTLHWGHQINFFNIITINEGIIINHRYSNLRVKTRGLGINIIEPFRLLMKFTRIRELDSLLSLFDLEYQYCRIPSESDLLQSNNYHQLTCAFNLSSFALFR